MVGEMAVGRRKAATTSWTCMQSDYGNAIDANAPYPLY